MGPLEVFTRPRFTYPCSPSPNHLKRDFAISDPNTSAAIDAMIAATNTLASAGADLTPQPQPPPGMTFNTADGAVTIHGDYPTAPAGADASTVHDSGRDLHAEANNLAAAVLSLEAKLAEHTFDRATGGKVNAVTGEARTKLEAQLARTRESVEYFKSRTGAIETQRAAAHAARTRQLNEQAGRIAFTRGDPERARLYDAALAKAEADAVAQLIVNTRLKART